MDPWGLPAVRRCRLPSPPLTRVHTPWEEYQRRRGKKKSMLKKALNSCSISPFTRGIIKGGFNRLSQFPNQPLESCSKSFVLHAGGNAPHGNITASPMQKWCWLIWRSDYWQALCFCRILKEHLHFICSVQKTTESTRDKCVKPSFSPSLFFSLHQLGQQTTQIKRKLLEHADFCSIVRWQHLWITCVARLHSSCTTNYFCSVTNAKASPAVCDTKLA